MRQFVAPPPRCNRYETRSRTFKSVLLTRDGREKVVGYHMGGEIVGIDGIVDSRHAAMSSRSKTVKFASCL
jgi:hypothetical protein